MQLSLAHAFACGLSAPCDSEPRGCGGGGLDCGGCDGFGALGGDGRGGGGGEGGGSFGGGGGGFGGGGFAEGGGDDGESATGVVKGGGGRATLRFSHVALMIAVRLARLGRIGGGVRKRARVVKLDRVADALCHSTSEFHR